MTWHVGKSRFCSALQAVIQSEFRMTAGREADDAVICHTGSDRLAKVLQICIHDLFLPHRARITAVLGSEAFIETTHGSHITPALLDLHRLPWFQSYISVLQDFYMVPKEMPLSTWRHVWSTEQVWTVSRSRLWQLPVNHLLGSRIPMSKGSFGQMSFFQYSNVSRVTSPPIRYTVSLSLVIYICLCVDMHKTQSTKYFL